MNVSSVALAPQSSQIKDNFLTVSGIIFFWKLARCGSATSLVLLTLIFSKSFRRTDGGSIVLTVGIAGFVAFTVGWQSELALAGDAISPFVNSYFVPLLSLICLGALVFGAGAVGKMGRDGAGIMVRLASFWVMFVMIPMGFAPVARLIDGDRGLDSTIQYFFEYLWRLSDIVSFGYLSSFDRAGYNQIVSYTSSNSYSVVVFNFLVGFFVMSSLVKLVKPDFSFLNRSGSINSE